MVVLLCPTLIQSVKDRCLSKVKSRMLLAKAGFDSDPFVQELGAMRLVHAFGSSNGLIRECCFVVKCCQLSAGDVNTVLDVAWSHLNSMNGTLAWT